ncbi:MAG: penicillin-binding protein 1A [Alphaproteobacteria bacterium]|nr:penicillin-binding protein 1A [Alphaproteobacteria bacterium]
MRFVAALAALTLFGVIAAVGGSFYVLWHFGKGLPEYAQLADYEPAVVTRVHAGDGRLMAEYATEKRVFVPLDAIPRRVVKAFLAAEDKNFYSHPGIDFLAMARAVVQNVKLLANNPNRRPIGASTITQQVARNFLLTDEVSLDRKVKEAILSFRIEQVLTKDRILELYLNEINLGFRAYGVGAAALNYFDKSLDDLTLAEAAYLAALPKAPNRYNPLRNLEAAQIRRDWVLDQMVEAGYVRADEAAQAKTEPLQVRRRDEQELVRGADYFAEEVRRELVAKYGEKMTYGGGLSVRTTLDPRLQTVADRALRNGLIAYDRRHGWRGPVDRIGTGAGWEQRLALIPAPAGTTDWRMALVLSTDREIAHVGFADGEKGRIPLSELRWARENKPEQKLGPPIERVDQVVKAGDVVLAEAIGNNTFALRQVPAVSGALVALDPHTGRVLAMAGGWSFEASQFNRATQAMRQPGSSFKPFVYMAALDKGYTPSTVVVDGPISLPQGPGLPNWTPKNYAGDSLGPVPLRVGIEKSRNQMTVRIGVDVGINRIADYAAAFGIHPNLPRHMSMVLGAGETTVLRHTAAYGMIVNGGKKITPTLIDRIDDRNGKTLYRHDQRPCQGCGGIAYQSQAAPIIPDLRPQIEDPVTAYQMVSMLQGVVERGTGVSIRELGRPLAGKTGTSNDANDTWFMGFSPDLAVGVFVGFDQPKSLGDRETGSSICVPIFKDFMGEALKDTPKTPFRIPQGIRLVRTNPETGRLARPGDKVIMDAFRPGSEPMTSDVADESEAGSLGVSGTGAPLPTRSPASGSGLY